MHCVRPVWFRDPRDSVDPDVLHPSVRAVQRARRTSREPVRCVCADEAELADRSRYFRYVTPHSVTLPSPYFVLQS